MVGAQEERRIVTALFADVVGSTALSERLDPEEARLVIGGALSRATYAVKAYGGTINKLFGDGLLALFGAPIAHEDDPGRAVRAALEIIATTRVYADEVRKSWGIEVFAMRIGIHTGEVVTGEIQSEGYAEYGVTGDTINTASRLQTAAAADEILVSDSTNRYVAAQFTFGSARTLALKGKSKPVTAFAVTGIRDASQPEESAIPLVGRDAELATALGLLDRLASRRGAVLFVVGEPGIGKTRLAAELRDKVVKGSGYLWMEGRCVSYGESLPYWPFRDLLRNWLEVSPTETELRGSSFSASWKTS